jgi:triosephosphate isomerase
MNETLSPWPRRPRLIAGNWKMHKTSVEGAALARALVAKGSLPSAAVVAVCPPFTALAAVGEALHGTGIGLGAQDLHPEPQGAFTGEIAGPMLVGLECRFVIVGHSERRHGMGEDDGLIARKLRAALRDGLKPIVCVGETLAEREAGRTDQRVASQVDAAYRGLDARQARATIVAYEPVWAIGTGRVATPDQAREAHRTVRRALDQAVGEGLGASIAVLYGGSVSAAHAEALFVEEELDGALVGGASLDPDGFWAIAEAASRAVPRER